MMTSIDENLSRLFAAPVIGGLFHAYDSTQIRCILCTYDSLYDYDATACTSGITSSTTVTTTFHGAAGFEDNCGLFEDTPGGHEDELAGFVISDYGYRFYNPELGRWINRDPIEERGGINLHVFASNNAINLFDLLGLSDCTLISTVVDVSFEGADPLEVYLGRFYVSIRVWQHHRFDLYLILERDKTVTTTTKTYLCTDECGNEYEDTETSVVTTWRNTGSRLERRNIVYADDPNY